MSYTSETANEDQRRPPSIDGTVAQAQQAGAEALEHASEFVQDIRERGSALAGAAGEHLTSTAESQKDALADRIEQVSDAVHKSAEHLGSKDDFIAKLVEHGAEELGSLADALRGNDLQGLISKLGGLARTQPALFVGACIATGFALTRVGRLAASGERMPSSTPADNGGFGAAPASGATGSATSGLGAGGTDGPRQHVPL